MASSFRVKINNLRKRSRVLLTRLEENAKVVRKEVKKLRVKDPSSRSSLNKRLFIYERHSDVWKLRNDSSGVGAALCPDYFRLSPKYESLSEPDMSAHRRLLLKTDKNHHKPSSQRRGIKECYCYTSTHPDARKISQRSVRTKHKPAALNFRETNAAHCGDGGTTVSGSESARIDDKDALWKKRVNEEGDNRNFPYSPPLSSATLTRAKKIDYTPRSKFLRKVQSKVNSLRSSSPESPVQLTPKSPCPSPRKYNARNTEARVDLNLKNEVEFPRKHNCRCVDDEAVDNSNKIPKKTLLPKKTIVSKKTANDQQKLSHCSRPVVRSPPPSKRVVRITCKDNYASRGEKSGEKNLRHSLPRDCYERTHPCSGFYRGEGNVGNNSEDEMFDFEINDVRKFREKNYFDTHASNPSLLGSKSSGSIQQFCLNERLFPEPMGKIHREDVVVSIPPCATRQKKTIHYFPRNLIKQEKNIPNINYQKKRRCPSCPLIGHAVDLGALKVSHPANSLALRYQKGIP